MQRWEAEGAWPATPPGPLCVDIGAQGPAAAYLVAVARVFDAPCSPALAPLLQPLPAVVLRPLELASDAVVGASLAEYMAAADSAGKLPDAAALEEALLSHKRWRLLAQFAAMWPCHRLGPALYSPSSLPSAALDLLLPLLPPNRCLRAPTLTSLYLSSSPTLQLLLLRAPPSLLRPALPLRSRLVWLTARARFEAEANKTAHTEEVAVWEKLIKHAWSAGSSTALEPSTPRWTLSNPYFARHASAAAADVRWERTGPSVAVWASWEAQAPPMSPLYYARLSSALVTIADKPDTVPRTVLSALAHQSAPAPGAAALAEWLVGSYALDTPLTLLVCNAAPTLITAQQLLHWLPLHALFPAATEDQAASSLAALARLWESAPHWTSHSLRPFWLRLLSSALPAGMPLFYTAASTSNYLLSILPALESTTKTDASLSVVAALATKRLTQLAVAAPPAPPSTPPPLVSARATVASAPVVDWDAEPARRNYTPPTLASSVPAAPPLLFSFPSSAAPRLVQKATPAPPSPVPPPPSVPPPVVAPAIPRSTAAPSHSSLIRASPAPAPRSAASPAPSLPPTPTKSATPQRTQLPVQQPSPAKRDATKPLDAQSPSRPPSVAPAGPSASPVSVSSPLLSSPSVRIPLRSSPAASASSPPASSMRRAPLPITPLKRARITSDEAEEVEEGDEVLLLK